MLSSPFLGMGYFRIVRIPLLGELDLGAVGIVITFFWIIGMINAYNFMDGIDGMAGGVAVVAGLGWMILSANVHNPFVFWVALAIAATSLGFLGHNWPPAKIFMGDVASTFLGYSFAVLPLLSADQTGDALTVGTLLMWIVIMDTFVTFLRRLVKGENVFSGHRSHLFQQLVVGGYKHGTISALYIFLTALAVLLSYEWSHGDQVAPLLIFLGLPLIWILLSHALQSHHAIAAADIEQRNVLNNFRNLNSLYQSLGARWLMFRVGYALRMRTGLIRKQIPSYSWQDRPLETWLKKDIPSQPEAYAQWRRQHSPKFFFEPLRAKSGALASGDEARIRSDAPWNPQLAVDEAERVLNGELKYFAHEFIKTGFPPDWHRDPVSGIKLDSSKHWSEISNEGDVDIKFIWEASRFSMVYTLVRAYASTRDEKFAEAFWELIQAWAEFEPSQHGTQLDGRSGGGAASHGMDVWLLRLHGFPIHNSRADRAIHRHGRGACRADLQKY